VRHIFALLPSSFHHCQSSVNKLDRVRKKANFHNFLREDSAKFFARKSQKNWTRVDGSIKRGMSKKTAAWSTLLAIDFWDDKSVRPDRLLLLDLKNIFFSSQFSLECKIYMFSC
jgi:hypothetical protein